MIKKILAGLVVLIAAFAGYVALQPDELLIQRQATIAAPPAAVFEQVNDLKKWDAWSPWAKMDPNAKVGFEGPAAGKDATFTWSGNDKIGEGRMTIVDSRPTELVDIKVDFTKPFENSSSSKFEMKPEADRTLVTWSMGGRQNFIEKAMCIVFNGKKMIGDEMEKGLSNLKTVAEKGAPAP
ncbi:MAG: SRPBCC family protein [Hyphomicrobium sp.]|jgi:uncharacterized protein YndB with AHSA1/START domain|nr:SRPBCC family protein [Hyphomicrobium sp.]